MRLAGEDELHRPLVTADDAPQFLEIAEDEVGALVEGEAAGEADGQSVRIEHLRQFPQVLFRSIGPAGLLLQTAADIVDQPVLE